MLPNIPYISFVRSTSYKFRLWCILYLDWAYLFWAQNVATSHLLLHLKQNRKKKIMKSLRKYFQILNKI